MRFADDAVRTRPPWAHGATAESHATHRDEPMHDAESISFAERVHAARLPVDITSAHIALVQDVVREAIEHGADAVCLDATAPRHARMHAFARILRPAIEQSRIPGIQLTDTATLDALYAATYSWGPVVQPLLDDPTVTEVKIGGTWALADGQHGRHVVGQPYPSAQVPLARFTALAQTQGVILDATNPSHTLPLPNKNRLHGTRPPLVPDDDILIVIRRGRTHPWTFDELVQRHAISGEAATLLQHLLHAWPSVLISGAQNSGKTTFLECALNTLPDRLHIVLVEDQTDEMHIITPLLTRLQVHDRGSAFELIRRETLRMTPDYVVPCEVRGAEAGAVIAVADNGRPTMTTIHGATPDTALRRLALFAASDVPHNVFANKYQLALAVATEAFHLVVHLYASRRLGRRIVESVHLLDGVAADGIPRLIPLITIERDGMRDDVQWQCHAQLTETGLQWRDAAQQTPARLARLLADRPSQHAAMPLVQVAAATLPPLLADIRAGLRDPGSGTDLIARFDQAAQHDPDHPDLWTLAERAWASHTGVRATVAPLLSDIIAAGQRAVAAADWMTARQIISAPRSPLLHVALAHTPQWHALHTTVVNQTDDIPHVVDSPQQPAVLQPTTAALDSILDAAHAAWSVGDAPHAWRLIADIDDARLAPADQHELWIAQRHILRTLHAAAEGDEQATLTQRLTHIETGLQHSIALPVAPDTADEKEASDTHPVTTEPAHARPTTARPISPAAHSGPVGALPIDTTVAATVGSGLERILDDPDTFFAHWQQSAGEDTTEHTT